MSEKPKFTPGPWRVVANFSNAYVCYGEPEMHDKNTVPPNQCVCGCGRKDWGCGYGDNLKNAYLIAAAPEMYDFVKAFTTLSGQLILMNADNGKEIYEKAVSICKKARGEK